MKLFWAIIALFLILAGIFFALPVSIEPFEGEGDDDTAARQSAQQETNKPQRESVTSDLFAEPEPDDVAPVQPSEESVDEQPDTSSDDAAEEKESAAETLVNDLLSDQPDGPVGNEWALDDANEHEHQPIKEAENPWAKEGELPLGDERLEAQRLEHSIVEQDDGSLLVDDTFVLRGEGTAESPYEVSWEMLMSAAETYQPRLGMEKIPERIEMLDGKHVKIAGHLMFPMVTAQADELLVMLNMWDGCCIGTMPSPYDAIEVQLEKPAPGGSQQYFNYGSIEGTLLVDPYLINDWLIGLYLMEDAELEVGM